MFNVDFGPMAEGGPWRTCQEALEDHILNIAPGSGSLVFVDVFPPSPPGAALDMKWWLAPPAAAAITSSRAPQVGCVLGVIARERAGSTS